MRQVFAWAAAFLLAAGLCGCTSRQGHERYLPSEDKARQALQAALEAWKSGKPPGRVETGAPPAVQAVDSRWQSGQKLAAYEILKEEPGDGPKVFAVKLTLQKPAGSTQVVRYVVVGADPLWVYREDDYKKRGSEM